MKIREILKEAIQPQEKLEAAIKEHCQQFLKQSAGLPVYRGMLAWQQFIQTKSDQKPRDSTNFMTACLSLYVELKFGINNIRRKDRYYGTGSLTQTKEYERDSDGKIYWIFPIDDFKFVWSPNVDDAMSYFTGDETIIDGILDELRKQYDEEQAENIAQNFHKLLDIKGQISLADVKGEEEFQLVKDEFFQYFEDAANYSNKNLKTAIEYGHEIMFQGDGYFIIEASTAGQYEKLYERLTS